MYRRLDGRFSSGSKNVHVLMITTPGRRTGIPRSTCVRYLETPAGLVVWGTGSGSRRDPDWMPEPAPSPHCSGTGPGARVRREAPRVARRGPRRHVAQHHPGRGARGRKVRAEGGTYHPRGCSRTGVSRERGLWGTQHPVALALLTRSQHRPRLSAASRTICNALHAAIRAVVPGLRVRLGSPPRAGTFKRW